MKLLFAFLLGLCALSAAAQEELSKLSFQEFDQAMGKGWRALADAGRYEEAGIIIDQYLTEALESKRYSSMLNFHAGQCYAFAGKTEIAVERFQRSFQREEPESYVRLARQWNAYVNGTVAFLQGDRIKLQTSRNEVAAGPEGTMKELNTKVLDRLIDGLGKSYDEVYNGTPKPPNQPAKLTPASGPHG